MTDMDVCLLLEGTYPFVTGGVSSWVHTLINELKHLRFGVVHISPREGYFPHGYAYKLPENVVGVKEVYLHQYKLPKKASRESIREQIQLFRGFIQDLQDGNTQAFRDFYAAVNQDLGGGLNAASIFQTKESWDVLVESYSQEAAEESFINYFWTWRYALFPLFNILAAQLPDAHLYHTISTGYAGMLAAGATLRKGRPMVLTEHGIYAKERRIEIHRADWIQDWSSGEIVAERKPPFFKRFWTRQFAMMSKVTYAHANEIYTLYEGNRRTQIQDGAEPERTNVIPNGIDLVRYGEAAKQFDARAENERFTLAFVGRVSPIKDVKTFLRAVRLVANEVPNVRARILGPMDEDPKYVDACKKLFQRLHLDGIAAFEGKVNVLEEFPKIDLLVLTSISEAQPLVILEAGAVGVPTVTTDVGSCSELLNGSSPEDRALGSGGLLTPIASPGETAKAILQLIRDRDQLKRMGRAMRQRVHRFYALKDMIAAYGDIYGKFQPGGRCFNGQPDPQRSAEKRAEPAAVAPTPALEAPQAVPLAPAAAAAPAPIAAPVSAPMSAPLAPAPAPATAPAPTAMPASPLAVAATAPALPSTSAPLVPSMPLESAAPREESIPPLEIETNVVPLVVEARAEKSAMPTSMPLLSPPPLPDLPRVLEAMAAPALPLPVAPPEPAPASAPLAPAPSTAVAAEPTTPMPTPTPTPTPLPEPPAPRVSTRGVLGELLQLQGLLEAWSAIDVELVLLLQEAEAASRAAERQSVEEPEAEANAIESDEFELGEDDLPADLPLSCEVLGDDDAEIETRAAQPRRDDDLGLELIDDLMQELADDVQGLRTALEREGEELSQLEDELICLDETEKLAAQQHGPLPDGTQTWWGSAAESEGEAVPSASAAQHAAEDAEAAEAESAAGEAIDENDAAAAAPSEDAANEEEEWLELDDEELPRDMPLSCDVLGEGGDDEEEAEASARPEPPRAGTAPAAAPQHAAPALEDDAAFDDEDESAFEEAAAAAEATATDETHLDAEPVDEEHGDDELVSAAHEQSAEGSTSDDEFELGEEDLPADLPLSCEALGDDDAAIETRAARPRGESELGLELIDDLMLELADDVQGLRSALQREGDELSQLEQELICLDETEKLAAEQHGPLPDGTQTWWGSAAEAEGEAVPSASAAQHAAEEAEAAEAQSGASEENDESDAASAAPSEDAANDEEEWLQLDDEELPRDMPLSCDVLGEGGDDEEEAEARELPEPPRAVSAPAAAPQHAVPSIDDEASLDDEHESAFEEEDSSVAASATDEASLDAEHASEAHEQSAAGSTSDDEFELGEEDLPADLPLSCEALGDDGAAIETRAARPRGESELGLELIDDLMRELADDVQGLRSALRREGDELSQLEQELICLDETEKLAAEQHGPLPEGTQTWWGSAAESEGEAVPSANAAMHAAEDAEAAEAESTASEENDEASAAPSEDTANDEEEWLELDDEELPRDMPLSCDVLGEGGDDEEEAEAPARPEPPRAVAAPMAPPQHAAPSRADEVSFEEEEEEEEEAASAFDEEATPAAATAAEEADVEEEHTDEEHVSEEHLGEAHEETAEGPTSDDEFELGEEDLPADLPLSCEALGDDGAAIETRAARPREASELGLELIDDLMLELAEDVQGLRSALQREGDELSQLEQDLICLDESTPQPEGQAIESSSEQPHAGLRELAGDAPNGSGELRFAAPPASVPPDPEVIAELDEPEAESAEEDEGWLELEEEELPRDLPLSCSALGDEDDDEDELAPERDEEDPA